MTGGAAALAREVEGEGVRLVVGRPKWGRVTRERGLATARAEREGELKMGRGTG
jgi:hypothetical protein